MDENVRVCDTTDTDGSARDAVAERQFTVAFDCDDVDPDQATVVVADAYETAGARDQAARNFEVQGRPAPEGAVWTYGQFTIHLTGHRDPDVADAVAVAMDRLGAE